MLDGVCRWEEVREGRTSVREPDTEVVLQPDGTKVRVAPTEKLWLREARAICEWLERTHVVSYVSVFQQGRASRRR